MVRLGGGAYFVVVGLGILASGVLIALGKRQGAWTYLVVFAVMTVWTFAECGLHFEMILPRLVVPGVICAYILFSKRLSSQLS